MWESWVPLWRVLLRTPLVATMFFRWITATAPEAAEADSAGGEPPKEITGLTEHGEQRAMGRNGGRGVSDTAMHDAVNNPIKPVDEQAHPDGSTYKYRGKDAVVVLNQNGEVVTTYAKSSAGLRNP